jgi:hypothetical protein
MPKSRARRRGQSGGAHSYDFEKRWDRGASLKPRAGGVNGLDRLAKQYQREAIGSSGGFFLDIVPVADPVFAPAILAWAARATANDPAHCLFPGCAARFGPGHGLPRLVAFVRASGDTIAQAGGICSACAGQADLERAALVAFGFDGEIRLFGRAQFAATAGLA